MGAATDVRSAEGMIATAGAIDVRVHFDPAGLCDDDVEPLLEIHAVAHRRAETRFFST